MARWATTSAGLVLLATSPLFAEEPLLSLTPERLRAAFSWGLTAPEKDLAQYELHSDISWLVNFDTPWLRVAQFARATKIQEQNATDEDVPASIKAPEVHVYAHAKRNAESDRTRSRLPDVEYLSILVPRPDRSDETVLPLSFQTFIRRVPQQDSFTSRTRIAQSARAAFPLESFRAGNRLRIIFGGGSIEAIAISDAVLARIR